MDILFKTTTEFQDYIIADGNTNFKTLKPFIGEATTLYLLDLLGDAFHAEFFTAYDDATLSADQTKLLPYIQRTLAYYTMFQGCDQLAVNIGDAGITEKSSPNSQPAPKYKIDALKLNYITQADKNAELLLAYLETNAATFPTWQASTANTAASGLLVPTATVAEQHIDINESRNIFKRLIKRIRQIEANDVKRLIGSAQYDKLVTEIKAANTTVAEDTLISMLQPIIAKKALFETLPSMKVGIDGNSIYRLSSNDGTVTKSAASKEEIKTLLWSLKDSDTGYMNDINQLEQFIIDNIEDYPLIEASTAYTSKPDLGPKRPPENLSTNKHFSV